MLIKVIRKWAWEGMAGWVVSYPDPNVRNDDYRLQYNITWCYTASDNHRYVHLGLGTRLLGG